AHRDEHEQPVPQPVPKPHVGRPGEAGGGLGRRRLRPHVPTSSRAGPSGTAPTSGSFSRSPSTHATRQATSTSARIATASSNAPRGAPWYPANAGSPPPAPSRPNHVNRVTNTATSESSNRTNSVGFG